MSALTNPAHAHARARVQYLYEEGFIDEYQISTDKLGQTLITTRVDGEDDWLVFFDETDVDYEGELE